MLWKKSLVNSAKPKGTDNDKTEKQQILTFAKLDSVNSDNLKQSPRALGYSDE